MYTRNVTWTGHKRTRVISRRGKDVGDRFVVHCPAKTGPRLCKGDSIERRRCVVGIGSGRSCLRPKTGLWASAEARNTVFCAETATEWAGVRLPRETWSSTRRRQTRGKGQGNITTLCFSADVWRKGPTSQYERHMRRRGRWPTAIVGGHSDALPHGLALRGCGLVLDRRRRQRERRESATGRQQHGCQLCWRTGCRGGTGGIATQVPALLARGCGGVGATGAGGGTHN